MASTVAAASPHSAKAHAGGLSGRVDDSVLAQEAVLEQQILSALQSGNPGDQAEIFTNQLPALIGLDPQAAARLAEAVTAPEWRTELMRVVAQKWAEAQPQAAAKWAEQLPNPNERDTVLSCVCFQVAATAPDQAVQILEQGGVDDDRRWMMLGNLAQQWAAQDASAATVWAEGYPPDAKRDHLLAQIAAAQSQAAPAAAAAMVAEQIPPGPIQEHAAITVLQQWAQQDWNSAVAWAEQFPAGEYYNDAHSSLAVIAAAKTSTAPPAGLQGAFP
jgi:hypothetical protein